MNVNSTIEVVNTSESVKQALQNEYRGCEVNEEECTVLIDGILYGYDLIKHMDEVDLSLYSIYELDKDDVMPTSDELSTLFDNNADCYADTRELCDDTIPPMMIEGITTPAMTKETFIKIVTELLKSKG